MTHGTRSRYFHSSCVAALLALTACGKADSNTAAEAGSSPAAASQGANDLVEIGDYRLSMDKIDKWFAAQRNVMVKAKSMSEAEKAAFESQSEGMSGANASIDDMARSVESIPMYRQAVRDAGLSPREYALVMMSFVQTGMAAGVAAMSPNANQDSLIRAMQANPENVKFYRANEAEITRKSKAFEEEMKRLGVEDM